MTIASPMPVLESGDLVSWRVTSGGAIAHPLTAESVSDAAVIAGLEPLVRAGALSGRDAFEAAAVQVITDCGDSPAAGWRAFYRNSVAELRSGSSPFAPVHQRARSLLRGDSVLEVGCCFGLFALQCAQDGRSVSALDLCVGALELLEAASADFDVPVHTRLGDARALPYDDDAVDSVTLIHLLEHLDEDDVAQTLAEAVRVARLRVIVAVPFEEVPSPHFGHLQQLTVADLRRWSHPWRELAPQISTHHGGWLILDVR